MFQLVDRIVEIASDATGRREERTILLRVAAGEFAANKEGSIERAETHRAMLKRRVSALQLQQRPPPRVMLCDPSKLPNTAPGHRTPKGVNANGQRRAHWRCSKSVEHFAIEATLSKMVEIGPGDVGCVKTEIPSRQYPERGSAWRYARPEAREHITKQ